MVNFARIFDRRVAHIGLLCCALAFLLRTKFPHPLTIFWGMVGVLVWSKIASPFAIFGGVGGALCLCTTHKISSSIDDFLGCWVGCSGW